VALALVFGIMVVRPPRAWGVAAPTITSVSSAYPGQQADAVVVNGTGFEAGATVSFSGSGITVRSVSLLPNSVLVVDVIVDCSIPPTARDVTVTNPDGGTVTEVGALTVLADQPILSSISPVVVGQGAGYWAVKPMSIMGSGFVPLDQLTFTGTDVFGGSGAFDSPSHIDSDVIVDKSAALTTRDAILTSPCGRQSILPSALRVDAGPTITSVDPHAVRRGDTDDTIVVTGTNFGAGATVTFTNPGVTSSSVSHDSDTQLTAHVAVSASAALGVDQQLLVTNPDGGTTNASFSITANQPAVFRNGLWLRRRTFTTGVADSAVAFGDPGDQPVACGLSGPVVYRDGVFYYAPQSNGFAAATFALGDPGDIGLCRTEWYCDANEFICYPVPVFGVYRPSEATFYVYASPIPQVPAQLNQIHFGNPGDRPVIGDWDGNGTATIGVVRNGTWYLANSDAATVADLTFVYGNPGDTPVVGDWNSTGADRPGVFRNGVWYTRDTTTTGIADSRFTYGNIGDVPAVVVS
jgi:hypothetical protein